MSQAEVLTTVDERLAKHFDEVLSDDWAVRCLSQDFRREGYVRIGELLAPDVRSAIRDEVYRLLEHANRIDTTLKATDNTPRRMSTVGARHIIEHSPLICELYESKALKDFLSRMAYEPVLPCPYEPERYVITKQERVGDTHGWHWGDYSFAVIWIIEAPEVGAGGMLQCVPHTDWNKEDPRVNEHLSRLPIKTYYHRTGDVYFLRTDTTLHRTVPLTEDRTRIILNTAFATAADVERPATHETMDALFD